MDTERARVSKIQRAAMRALLEAGRTNASELAALVGVSGNTARREGQRLGFQMDEVGCATCSHPQLHLIELSMLSGVPYRSIADRFTLTRVMVEKHARNCMGLTRLLGASCPVCDHPDCDTFDEMLTPQPGRAKVRNGTYARVAAAAECSTHQVNNHRNHHIGNEEYHRKRALRELSRFRVLSHVEHEAS